MTESAKTPDRASSPHPGKPARAVPPVPPPPSAPPDPRSSVPDQAGTAGTADKAARERPDPTRFGDWEKNGRCIDF